MRLLAKTALVVSVIVAFASLAGPLRADFDAGLLAIEKGDIAAALDEWLKSAEQADPRAQYHLAMLYEEGKVVARDYDQALRWYVSAAEQGHAGAEYRLGLMYYFGQGARQDNVEAIRWLRLAAGHGEAEARQLLVLLESTCDFP
ncbi:MAG: tetratricopeptide repeat protein [Syntrophobacteraceae bacterium]